MKNAVMSPQAMNAAILGITIAARFPPKRCIRSRTVAPSSRLAWRAEDGVATGEGQLPVCHGGLVTNLTRGIALVSAESAADRARQA
jgi:hypothetical protein